MKVDRSLTQPVIGGDVRLSRGTAFLMPQVPEIHRSYALSSVNVSLSPNALLTKSSILGHSMTCRLGYALLPH